MIELVSAVVACLPVGALLSTVLWHYSRPRLGYLVRGQGDSHLVLVKNFDPLGIDEEFTLSFTGVRVLELEAWGDARFSEPKWVRLDHVNLALSGVRGDGTVCLRLASSGPGTIHVDLDTESKSNLAPRFGSVYPRFARRNAGGIAVKVLSGLAIGETVYFLVTTAFGAVDGVDGLWRSWWLAAPVLAACPLAMLMLPLFGKPVLAHDPLRSERWSAPEDGPPR